jgi:hypothetical protein
MNEELKLSPERVNKALELLREGIPHVDWDIPYELEEFQ